MRLSRSSSSSCCCCQCCQCSILSPLLFFVIFSMTFLVGQVTPADQTHHNAGMVDRRYELQILRRLLAAGYTYYARPLTIDNGTLEVRTRLSLIKIQNLWERTDVKTEALEVTMRIQLVCSRLVSFLSSLVY